jgi:hypothetical protein
MEINKKESLLLSKEDIDKKYNNKLNFTFDYEINNYNLQEIEYLNDQLAEKFYKCETVNVLKRKWMKKLVSKNKIRLVNKQFDLDLM